LETLYDLDIFYFDPCAILVPDRLGKISGTDTEEPASNEGNGGLVKDSRSGWKSAHRRRSMESTLEK